MFPLNFPFDILRKHAKSSDRVLDPFCGRGTTNFAARLLGLPSMGVDSSPVAVAITASKLVVTNVNEIMAEAFSILAKVEPSDKPKGEFWDLAYHPLVLDALCSLREAFLEECANPARIALRGIVLGALHGPKQKTVQSYFSNQCPRTYAPKPDYATRFWRERGLKPEAVDVMAVIERRAKRYYESLPRVMLTVTGTSRLADSRQPESLQPASPDIRFDWVITSPPYYGMRTYIPDQWLRNWFLGGNDAVDYSTRNQLVHKSPQSFANDLKQVWHNAVDVCNGDAKLVVRFGGIRDRKANPLDIITASFDNSGWRIAKICDAGSALKGKRQAATFLRKESNPMAEYDLWAIRDDNAHPRCSVPLKGIKNGGVFHD